MPFGVGPVAGTGTSSTGPGPGPVSKTCMAICIPPTPSVRLWCTFITRAARSPSSPSIRVQTQGGRDSSNPVIASPRANSITVSGVRGDGASIRRRWRERSNSQSTHRGVDSPAGDRTGRWRNRGITLVACSRRAATTSKSGRLSSQVTATMVDRRVGSCSMFHARASGSRMNRSSSVVMSPPPVSLRVNLRRPAEGGKGRRSSFAGRTPLVRRTDPRGPGRRAGPGR